MKYLLIILLFTTGCDVLKTLKYKYYYSQKGEMLCGTEEGKKLYLSKLNEGYPVLIDFEKKVFKLNKVHEDEKILNLQKLTDEGFSSLYILDKVKANLLVVSTGKENEQIMVNSFMLDCR